MINLKINDTKIEKLIENKEYKEALTILNLLLTECFNSIKHASKKIDVLI